MWKLLSRPFRGPNARRSSAEAKALAAHPAPVVRNAPELTRLADVMEEYGCPDAARRLRAEATRFQVAN
jgi:hypothetical protein